MTKESLTQSTEAYMVQTSPENKRRAKVNDYTHKTDKFDLYSETKNVQYF
jgi:hypothetical protein